MCIKIVIREVDDDDTIRNKTAIVSMTGHQSTRLSNHDDAVVVVAPFFMITMMWRNYYTPHHHIA